MIHTTLMPHQKRGLSFIKNNSKSALFWKPGLGKSLAALAWVDWLKTEMFPYKPLRVLITADLNNILNTWPEQIARHTDFNVVMCAKHPKDYDMGPDPAVFEKPTCCLFNYDILYRRPEWTDGGFDVWIGDESSEFKDVRTTRFQGMRPIISRIPYRLILNGEPVTERITDLYGQFLMLDDGWSLGKTFMSFANRFLQPSPDGYGFVAKRSAFTMIQKHTKNTAHWITKAEGITMPKKHYIRHWVDMSPEQKELDTQLATQFAATFKEKKIEVNHAAALFQKRLQLAGGVFRESEPEVIDVRDEGGTSGWASLSSAKLTVVKDLLEEWKHKKVVIWHQYIPETILLHYYLDKASIEHSMFTSPDQKSVLDDFRKKESGVLLIRNSMCKGLNQLADADLAIFYSNPLSFKTRVQAEGRSTRIDSRTKDTTYVDILIKGGMDEVVYHMLQQKKTMSLTLSTLDAILRARG